ncbi:MAG: rod shape-determining protein MreC [Deltaproteobacteria bacterium]|nr:rod shape-determining protein MreC [Deltaproteobacteria bacterium]
MIFFLFFLMSLNREDNRKWNPVEQAVVEITAPFQRLFSGTINGVQNIWIKYFSLINTREESARLKEQIAALKMENYRSRELLAACQRLQGLLSYTETTSQEVLAVRVIGRDPTGLFQSVIIDKGKDSGLSVNMPVVNGDGVVGRIVSVSSNYSKVLLIIDQNSAVDCLVQSTRDNGIVKGLSSDKCIMDYVLKTSDINVGDIIITSGIGGIFPKGVPVGEVTDIKDPSDEIFLEVMINPFVDFSKLEEILVILMEDPLAENSKEKG